MFRENIGNFFDQVVADVFELYERRMHASNAMDFDDLLVRSVELLESFDDVRERWQGAFNHLLVDEYQDTNHAQYRIVRLLSDAHRNVMVVGDADQAIYTWRGADIRNILDFERDFPDARVVRLEQNYRSSQRILDAANAVIEHNAGRIEKQLWSELGNGEPVRVIESEDEHDEARIVSGAHRRAARGRHERLRDRGLLPHERAVARARGSARPPRRAVPGDRRPALLRARRGQGRDGVPERARQPDR